jgi:lysophospholipase L1-like esterase
MKLRIQRWAAAAALLSMAVLVGCEGNGNDDVGDNNINLVACIGDSITMGYNCEGAPYPTRLAAKSGKTVLNFGVGGTISEDGLNKVELALARNPGYVCIFYGANDAIHGVDPSVVGSNLRRIVRACRAKESIPLLATPTPQQGGHGAFNGQVMRIAEVVRGVAKEEGARLIDLNKAFGDGEGLLVDDGLHMTAAGSELIAEKFNAKM